MITIYGIPNCDTCKKARRWLESQGIDHRFHDVRVDGIDRDTIERWFGQAEWKTLLNTRSTTWRTLPEASKTDVDAEKALALMLEHPTLVKRPVLEHAGGVEVGFKADRYASLSEQ